MAIVLKKIKPKTSSSTPPKKTTAGKNPAVLPKKKGEAVHEQKKTSKPSKPKAPIQKQATARKEAPKPAVSSGNRAESSRPRGSLERSFRDSLQKYEGQITHIELPKLSYTARYELWKELNKEAGPSEFITLLEPHSLPYGVKRDLPPPSYKSPSSEALWCCYCAEWMKFRQFSYLGNVRCTGCGMSTKDFHIVRANNLKT